MTMTDNDLSALRSMPGARSATLMGVCVQDIIDHIDQQAALLVSYKKGFKGLENTCLSLAKQAGNAHARIAVLERQVDAYKQQLHTRDEENAATIETLAAQRDHARAWANFWQENWGDMLDDPAIAVAASDGWKVGQPVASAVGEHPEGGTA